MRTNKLIYFLLFGALLLFSATSSMAAGPSWMPGFPMRMGPSVMLMWTPIPGATSYNVYKSAKEGDLGTLLTAAPMNNFVDPAVPMEQSAFYTIKAVIGGAEGEAGQVGKVVGIKPPDPPKWVGHMDAEGQVTLRFDAVPNAAFYNLTRAENKEGPFTLVGSLQETKFTDANITEGGTYYYQLTAVDRNNAESAKSQIYEYTMPKKVARAAAAKTFELVEKLVKLRTTLYGPEQYPLLQPSFFARDGANLIVYDVNALFVMGLDDSLVRVYQKPADYQGEWGTLRGFGELTDDGLLPVAFIGFDGVRGLQPEGKVAFEFLAKKPTKEEYEALDRLKDWEKDKNQNIAPRDVAVDGEGRFWMTEPVFAQVHIYERSGELLKKIGDPMPRGFELKDMRSPAEIIFHEKLNRLYVLDQIAQTVRAFDASTMDFIKDAEGNPIYGWKRAGAVPGGFQEPRGIDVMEDGNIVITDGIDGRIQIFDPQMDYLGQLVTKAGDKRPEGAGSPMDVKAVGNSFIVAEPLAKRIRIYEF